MDPVVRRAGPASHRRTAADGQCRRGGRSGCVEHRGGEGAGATAGHRRRAPAERGPVPNGWLVTTERDRALERIGRDRTMASKAHLLVAEGVSEGAGETTPSPDGRLEPTSTCWHPARAVEATVVLALHAPCGPTTPETARVAPGAGYCGAGSFASPRTRSPMMLRMTSSDPPAIRIPGTPRRYWDQA